MGGNPPQEVQLTNTGGEKINEKVYVQHELDHLVALEADQEEIS
jgi:hypothetical protein